MAKTWLGVVLLFLPVFLSEIIAYTSGEYLISVNILTLEYWCKYVVKKFHSQRPSYGEVLIIIQYVNKLNSFYVSLEISVICCLLRWKRL